MKILIDNGHEVIERVVLRVVVHDKDLAFHRVCL